MIARSKDKQRVIYMVGSARFRAASRVGRRFDKRVIIYFTAPRRLPKVRGPRMDGIFGARETRDFDIGEKNTCRRRGTMRARGRETRQSVGCEYHKPINRRSSRARSRTSSTRVSRQTTTKSLLLESESALERSKPWRCSSSPLANFQTRRPSSHWWRTCHHGGRVEGS